MRARNPVVILIVAALIGVATPAVAQWSVDTVGGPPMAEELGVRNQLAVGVFCQNGSQTVRVMLMGQPLQAVTVSARWSDGSSDNYRLRLGRNGHLTGTGQVAQAMIAKLRRLNSVTLGATGPGSVVVEDTISLRGSSQAIGRIGCASSPRRRASTRTEATPSPRRMLDVVQRRLLESVSWTYDAASGAAGVAGRAYGEDEGASLIYIPPCNGPASVFIIYADTITFERVQPVPMRVNGRDVGTSEWACSPYSEPGRGVCSVEDDDRRRLVNTMVNENDVTFILNGHILLFPLRGAVSAISTADRSCG